MKKKKIDAIKTGRIEKTGKPDYFLLASVTALLILGILILASVATAMPKTQSGGYTYFLFHQITNGLIPGIILGFIAFKISIALLRKWIPFLLLGNLALMLAVFIPGIGFSLRGATRWIGIGSISFQPSEFLKLIFILYVASWLCNKVENKQETTAYSFKKDFMQGALLPFLVILGSVSLLLILQPDISTLGIIVLTASLMYFCAGTFFWHSILIITMGITGLLCLMRTAPYRWNRLMVFFHSGFEPMGLGYQVKQAIITIGSGGIFGLGLGMGVQKYGFLPQPMSDSVFAVFAEETGFLGVVILMSIFLIFTWQGFNIAKQAKDKFLQLTAFGITCWIILQTFVNISATAGMLPLTGIPLPFISYGGTHLIAELVGVGILLNISKQLKG
jgi:cell division protein FtsW